MMRATMRGLVTSWTLCCFGYLLLGTIQTGTQTNLAVSVCLFSLIASWAVWSVTGRRQRSTSHGSASWADARALKRVLLPPSRTLEPGALSLGLKDRRHAIVLPPDLARLHVLVVGGSGSGKTWGFFLPNAAHARGSFVATDPKGELWHHTSGYHQNAWRFAPREPEASRSFNWIPLCREEYVARLLAAAALQVEEDPHEEQFWKLAELQLCTALFAHAARTKIPTPATVWQLLRLGPRELLEPLKQSPASVARTCAALLADQKPEARAGIVLGVVNKLAFLEDPTVRRFTSADLTAPDFASLTREPTAAYWVVHEQDAAILQPLSAVFFTLLLDELSRGDVGAIPVTLLLDELANVGRIPHFPVAISVARGRGLSLALGVQALSQLDGLYGHNGADTIRTNCATKVVLHGLDYHSAEEVSRALGETTVAEELASRRRGEIPFVSDVSFTEHQSQRRLLTADEVRRIGTDESLLIISNLPPILARRQRWNQPPRTGNAPRLGPEHAMTPPRPKARSNGATNNVTHLRDKLKELEDD